MGYATRYVPSSVRVYPDTDVVEEYGGTVSLEKFGSVVVSGRTADNGNRIATATTSGRPFHARPGRA
jgi:non-heme Fe2+,alpha-ketoglutarate-dependent halogenase